MLMDVTPAPSYLPRNACRLKKRVCSANVGVAIALLQWPEREASTCRARSEKKPAHTRFRSSLSSVRRLPFRRRFERQFSRSLRCADRSRPCRRSPEGIRVPAARVRREIARLEYAGNGLGLIALQNPCPLSPS